MKYTHAELVKAYERWIKTPEEPFDKKIKAWDEYCDVRDSLPIGTTASKKISRNLRIVKIQ